MRTRVSNRSTRLIPAALALLLLVAVVLPLAASAAPGQPNFTPQIYADGQAFGTKGNGPLPRPTETRTYSPLTCSWPSATVPRVSFLWPKLLPVRDTTGVAGPYTPRRG